MNVFDLFAKLSLDSSEYNEELGDAEKSTSNFGDKLKKGLKVAAGAATAAITTATAATITLTKKFVDAAKATSETGDKIDKQSQKVGFSYKKWQEWNYVLTLAGSSMESATMGIKTMTNQVDKAKNGNKEAVATFKSLGISVKDLKKMSREEIFEKLIAQLQKMPESTKRAALANKLFGRSGQELTPLLNQSAESTKNLIEQANKLGIVMDDKGVKASANFQDSLTTLKMTADGLKNSLMTKFLPSLTSVTDGLAKVFGAKTEQDMKDGISAIEYGLKSLSDKLVEMTPKIVEVGGKILKALIDGFTPMLPTVISALFSLVSEALKALVSMLPQLKGTITSAVQSMITLLVTLLPILIDGVMQLITALAEWLGTPENARLISNGIVSMITSIAKTISTTLPIILPAIVTLITEIAKCLTEEENLRLVLTAVWEIIKAVAIAIGKSVPILLEALGTVIGNLFTAAVDYVAEWIEFWVNEFKRGWKMFTDALAEAGKAIVNFFTGIANKIKEFFTGIVNKVKEVFTNIKNKVSEFFGGIKQFFTDGFNAIKQGISDALGKVKGFFSDMLSNLRELPKKALEAGKNIVGGIIDGVKSMIKKAVDAVKNLGKNMMDGIKGFFKIKSPSRLMRDEVGRMLGLGISEGFEDSLPDAVGDMKASLSGMTADLNASISPAAVSARAGGSMFNAGGFTINVYGAEGQDVRTLAKMVSQEIQNLITDKEKAYA